MNSPDDSLSRERGTPRSTTRHREDPVKVAPSGRASRISRDYVKLGGCLGVSIAGAYARRRGEAKLWTAIS
jgi:hypothetical protein